MPTPEEQVQFLRSIQRLLAEGSLVASYKFALIHALADLADASSGPAGGDQRRQTKLPRLLTGDRKR
jgi:hypothetical protein